MNFLDHIINLFSDCIQLENKDHIVEGIINLSNNTSLQLWMNGDYKLSVDKYIELRSLFLSEKLKK